MVKRSAKLLGLYLLGILLIGGWSLSHVLGGTVSRENFALVVVLPAAWICSYWPTVGSLLAVWKVRRLQGVLEDYMARRAAGAPTDAPEAELEDTLTLLVAQENGLPERWARKAVRRFLSAARTAR